MSAFDEYKRWLTRLVPGWLRGPRGEAFLAAIGAVLDDYVMLTLDGVKARYPNYAPTELLPLIGDTRDIKRLPGENDVSYRGRLLKTFEAWMWAGTERGLIAVLSGAGYDAQIGLARQDAPDQWAEFDVYIQGEPPTLWELWRLAAIVNEFKPAHTKIRCFVFAQQKLRWNGGGQWDISPVTWDGESANTNSFRLCGDAWDGIPELAWNGRFMFWDLGELKWS